MNSFIPGVLPLTSDGQPITEPGAGYFTLRHPRPSLYEAIGAARELAVVNPDKVPVVFVTNAALVTDRTFPNGDPILPIPVPGKTGMHVCVIPHSRYRL